MPVCSTCGELKDAGQFSWRNRARGQKWKTCKSCQSKQRKRWYRRNKDTHKQNVAEVKRRTIAEARAYVLEYLSTHPCETCGESDPAVLEFHHRPGTNKRMRVGAMMGGGYSVKKVRQEIAKCQVLCANCHRRITAKDQGWYKG